MLDPGSEGVEMLDPGSEGVEMLDPGSEGVNTDTAVCGYCKKYCVCNNPLWLWYFYEIKLAFKGYIC